MIPAVPGGRFAPILSCSSVSVRLSTNLPTRPPAAAPTAVAASSGGATLAAVRKAFRRGQSGVERLLDFEHTSYTARIDGGTKQITELEFDKPGKYALLCFVSDRKGGPPHVARGMIAEATVH